MNFFIQSVVALFIQIASGVGAANILGLFLTHSPSHVIIHMSVVRALVERGHNVTVITSIPLNEKNPACRHIILKQHKPKSDIVSSIVNASKVETVWLKTIGMLSLIKQVSEQHADFSLDPEFINFMAEDNQFDLMILGYLYNDYQLGVAAHFKCPVVLSFIVQPFGHVSRLIGSPAHPAFVPLSPFLDSKPMDFVARIHNFIVTIMEWVVTKSCDLNSRNLYYKYFPRDKYPSYSEVKKNISLLLFNHHFSEGPVRPLIPGMVEIGGIQIKDKPDQLPKDIEDLLNNSSDGAIFFSLGSNIRREHVGTNASDIIFRVLSTLPYNVIWKSDPVDGQQRYASNILFKKWLPQDDILSHKNLKLFITHAGKGSVTESEYHGVPMVALPIMGDQFNNAETMEAKGHGVKLNYQTMTEKTFREAILSVITNDKYRNEVRTFSRVYRDRPLTARENAVYWIEYVLRHKGAAHMQSPLKDMNIFQENCIDVILFLSLIIYLIFKAIKSLGKFMVMAYKLLYFRRTVKNKYQ